MSSEDSSIKTTLTKAGLSPAWDFVLKGNDLRGNKEYDKALVCFDRAIEIDPKLGHAYMQKAFVLRRLNQPDEALRQIDIALSHELEDHDRATSLMTKAAMLAGANQATEAEEILEQALFGEHAIKRTNDTTSTLARMHVLKSALEAEKNFTSKDKN